MIHQFVCLTVCSQPPWARDDTRQGPFSILLYSTCHSCWPQHYVQVNDALPTETHSDKYSILFYMKIAHVSLWQIIPATLLDFGVLPWWPCVQKCGHSSWFVSIILEIDYGHQLQKVVSSSGPHLQAIQLDSLVLCYISVIKGVAL